MKITKKELLQIIREEINESSRLVEAEETSFDALSDNDKAFVNTIEHILGHKHSRLWDGIHGKVVSIQTPNSPTVRLDRTTLNKLSSTRLRWIDINHKGEIWVGF